MGIQQTVRDQYDLLVAELPSQTRCKRKVLCGGHSLGGAITGYTLTRAGFDSGVQPRTLSLPAGAHRPGRTDRPGRGLRPGHLRPRQLQPGHLALLGGDGLLAARARQLPGTTVVAPGYQHLDVLTAAAKQNDGLPERISTSLAAFATR